VYVLDTSGVPTHVLGKPQAKLRILQLPVCWLQVGVHPKVTATGLPGTGFLGLPLFFKQMLRWFPSSKLLLRVFHAAFQI
jgi:hypothetical protein